MPGKQAEKNERENLPIVISLINKSLFEDASFDSIAEDIMGPTRYAPQCLRRIFTN
jgi:hypothetical protein